MVGWVFVTLASAGMTNQGGAMSHFKKFVDWVRSPQGQQVIMALVEAARVFHSSRRNADEEEDDE